MAETAQHAPATIAEERGRRPRSGRTPRRKPSPYYTELDTGRREYAVARHLVGWYGTHLICPLKGCRRAGRCQDDSRAALPFCFYHHRGMIRFLVQLAIGHGPTMPGDLEPGAEPPEMAPHSGPTFLETVARTKERIALFRRPLEAGQCDWDWESDPDAVAYLAKFRADKAARAGR